MLSVPLSDLVLTAAGKKGPSDSELRAFAAGVMAHLAIQTLYRLEHPGHFIITERLATLGDRRISTISRFGRFDGLKSGGRALVERARKAALRGAPAKIRTALEGDDFWALLVYLLDVSTDESSRSGVSKKRYDILDFGPLGTSDLFPVKTALAYEIKSLSDVDKGTAYVKRQTDAFNSTVGTLAATLQSLFSVRGLLGYTAVPGMVWPAIPHVIPVGPNVLHFYLAAPGVIAYEWLRFKRVSLKQLWNLVRATAREVRDAYRREQRVGEDIQGLATVLAAVAVIGVGLLAIELAAASAAGATAAGQSGRLLLARLLSGGGVLGPALANASGASAAALDRLNVDRLLEAMQYASDPATPQLRDPGVLPVGREASSGGTGPTEFERAVEAMAAKIAEQFVFLYAVRIGQGDEILDDSATQLLKATIADWFRKLLSVYGVDEFLEMFGVQRLDDAAAAQIAQLVVNNGSLFVSRETYGSLLAELVLSPMQDILDSLPEGFGDDGEAGQ